MRSRRVRTAFGLATALASAACTEGSELVEAPIERPSGEPPDDDLGFIGRLDVGRRRTHHRRHRRLR